MDNSLQGLSIGTVLLNRYRIEKELGGGGMGFVYLSKDEWQKDTYVVIKTPISNLLSDEWIVKKIKQEAESLARLNHRGIVKLLGHEFNENNPFLILEYISGRSLKEIIPELQKNPARIAKLLLMICEAVHYAHDQHVFHRDLKPENIMVQYEGTDHEAVKIIDFGIARIDNSFFADGMITRHRVGTPYYISPNRLRDEPDDRADDIYAIGLIAYEMFTGRNPVGMAGNFEDLKKLQELIPSPRNLTPYLPPTVNREIIKALSLNPINRQESALKLGRLIHQSIISESNDLNPGEKTVPDHSPLIETNPELYFIDEEKLLSAISNGERALLNGDFETATQFYDEKILAIPNSDLLYSRRSLAFLMNKDFEKAMADCAQTIRINPKNDFAYLIKGIIYRLKLGTAEAENYFQKCLELNPGNLEAALILGDIHASRNESENALKYYAHVCRVNPCFSWVYTSRGSLYYDRHDFLAAVEDFTLAIKYNPTLAWNFYKRAKALKKVGKTSEAISDLNQAIYLTPDDLLLYNERSKLLFKLGKNKEALEDFNLIKEFSADNSFRSFQSSTNNENLTGLASIIDYLKWLLVSQ